METLLYGVKIGLPDYMEEILTNRPEKFELAKIWAKNNGFDRFRVSDINLTVKPNFIKTLN